VQLYAKNTYTYLLLYDTLSAVTHTATLRFGWHQNRWHFWVFNFHKVMFSTHFGWNGSIINHKW